MSTNASMTDEETQYSQRQKSALRSKNTNLTYEEEAKSGVSGIVKVLQSTLSSCHFIRRVVILPNKEVTIQGFI